MILNLWQELREGPQQARHATDQLGDALDILDARSERIARAAHHGYQPGATFPLPKH